MATDTTSFLITAVSGWGAAFTASYPSGRTRADYELSDSGHLLQSTGYRTLFYDSGEFTLTFNATNITVTLTSSIAFAAGTTLFLVLNRGDAEIDRINSAIMRFTFLGAVGDGSTDNRAAMAKAVSQLWDGPVRIDDEGTFDLDMSPGETLALTNWTHIVGGRNASLVLNASGAGTTQLFGSADDVLIENLTVAASHADAGETIVLGAPKNRNVVMLSSFDGGVTDAGGTPSHIAHTWNISDNDVDGFLSFGNRYSRVTRVLLKTNTSVKTHRNFLFLADTFKSIAGETIPGNNPDGTFTGLMGLGLFASDSIASDVGNSDHFFGAANVEGMIGTSFWITGEYGEPLHVEEGTRLVCFSQIAAKLDDANAFFSAQDWNEGDGTYKIPELLVLSNFVAERTSRGSNNWAVDLVNDASGFAPLKRAIIANGIATGWSSPGRAAEDPYTVAQTNLMAYDCGEAWQLKVPTLMWDHNYSIDNDAGLDLQDSGVVGHIHTYREAGWDGTSTVLKPPPTVTSGRIAGFTSWSAEQEGVTCAGAATNYLLVALGAKLIGRIEVTVTKTGTASVYCIAVADLHWDGATLTPTVIADEHTGLSFVDFRNDGSGNLAIRINSGSAQTNCYFQVKFRGIHLFT